MQSLELRGGRTAFESGRSRFHHSYGVVMVIVLIAMVLLAALVFYVMNLGRQVNARVVTQHSADVAVISGAGWVARSLNTVAMNNVAISRYLATINTLDSMPLVTHAALPEQTTLRDAIELRKPTFTMNSSVVNSFAHAQADILYQELEEEVKTLHDADDFFNQNDVGLMTRYNNPSGRGSIWNAMTALDQFSQAVMENLGPLASLNAERGGVANMPNSNETAALLVPDDPQVPWRRGVFDDFQMPVTRGRLPAAVDNDTTNRGPYDTVFGWGHRRPHGGGAVFGSGPTSPFGDGALIPSGNSSGITPPPTSYNTYGTEVWMTRVLGDMTYHRSRPNLNRSRFFPWLPTVSNAKLGYLWSGLAPQYFAVPRWDLAYPADLPQSTGQPTPFSETGYFILDFKSRYAYDDSAFGTSGSIVVNNREALTLGGLLPNPDGNSWFQVSRKTGWWLPVRPGSTPLQYMEDPLELNGASASQVYSAGPMAWVVQLSYTVTADPSIGISPSLGATGIPLPQPAYFVQLVIYAGVNRNLDPPQPLLATQKDPSDVLITNPYDGFDRTAASAPAPTDLDHTLVTTSPDARRQYLTFLGIAHQSDRSLMWPSRFVSNQPYPNIVALAQAKVFNDHSWDLWTQMWHAQLEPISGFDVWLTQMDAGAPEHEYLQSIQPLAPMMLSH